MMQIGSLLLLFFVIFLIMASTFLFGIANHNGTSTVLARNVSFLGIYTKLFVLYNIVGN